MTQPGPDAQSGIDPTQSGGGPDATGTGASNGVDPAGAQSGTQVQQPTFAPPSEEEWKRQQEELEKQRQRALAADKRAGDAESKYKQLTEKDLPELERLKNQTAELLSRAEKAEAQVRELRIGNAFLTDNTYTWHNPQRALELADKAGISIEEDGSVTGLKDSLKKLAASDPYLIKTENNAGDGGKTGPPSTVPGNNGGSGGGAPNKSQMAIRFPAMRTRV